ncbi:MAG: hypothetical protein OXN89_00685 [Bryobacterales bacterium]|nr:hypothetical protein [Bryobacterales bacterium]
MARLRPLGSLWISPAVALAGLVLCLQGCGPQGEGEATPDGISDQVEQGSLRLELRLDRKTITTADQLQLTLFAEAAEGEPVEFPSADREDDFGQFGVVREAEIPSRLLDGGTVLHGRDYWLQPFLPGDYELPSLKVRIGDSSSLSTDPLIVPVTSSLIEGDSELQDIAGPLDVPVPWWQWVVGGVAAVALGTLLLYWIRQRRRAAVPEPPPPHEVALAALDALLNTSLLADGDVDAFYRGLSAIVRHYIEGRFGVHAPERTTEEFLREISGLPVISKGHQALLRDFLQSADMVKFAKFVPARDETSGAVTAARNFIRQTIPLNLAAASDEGETPQTPEPRGPIAAA